MHALFVTFHASAGLDALHDALMDAAHAIAEVDGLLTKTWIREGERIGAFYVFTDAEAAQAYLDGPIVAAVMATDTFSDWEVRRLEVIDSLSEVTRGMPAASTAAD